MSTFSIKVEIEWDSKDVTLGSGATVILLSNCALGAFPSLWEGVGTGKDGTMDGLPTLVAAEAVMASTAAFVAERVETLA